MRFLWFRPWASTGEGTRSASFDPDRYVAGGSPLLYRPVRVNNVNLAQNPVTGELKPQVYVGSFVPNTGDPYNGMVTNDEWPTYGIGFRVSQGIQPEGRVGVAWDITGSGKTSLHASLGRYHNGFVNANGLDVLARQPPAQNNPVLRYSTIALMQTPEAQAAFDKTPSGVTGFQHDAPTPQSLNYSIGDPARAGLGHGGRRDLCGQQDGADRGDLPRTTICRMAPTSSTSTRRTSIRRPEASCRPTSCGPIGGTAASGFARTPARRITTPCRCSSTAGTSRASSSRWPTRWPRGTTQRVTSPYVAADQDWFWRAPTGGTQLHNLTISYTWDVPDGSRLWDNALTRGALDGWQLSGNTAFVSGDWVGRGLLDDGQLRLLRRRRRRSHRPDRASIR